MMTNCAMKASEPARSHVEYAPPQHQQQLANKDTMELHHKIILATNEESTIKQWCDENGAFLSMLKFGPWHDCRLNTSGK